MVHNHFSSTSIPPRLLYVLLLLLQPVCTSRGVNHSAKVSFVRVKINDGEAQSFQAVDRGKKKRWRYSSAVQLWVVRCRSNVGYTLNTIEAKTRQDELQDEHRSLCWMYLSLFRTMEGILRGPCTPRCCLALNRDTSPQNLVYMLCMGCLRLAFPAELIFERFGPSTDSSKLCLPLPTFRLKQGIMMYPLCLLPTNIYIRP